MTTPDLLEIFATFANNVKHGDTSMRIDRSPVGLRITLEVRGRGPKAWGSDEVISAFELRDAAESRHRAMLAAMRANAVFDRLFPTVKEEVPPGYGDTL